MSKLNNSKKISIAIIGGGMMGIASAIYLAKTNLFKVTLFEKEKHLGGLSSSYSWKDITFDRYYHVFLSTDTEILELINELELTDSLFWKETKSGFYSNGKLVSLSSSIDFIKFPFMSLWEKFRFALGILYSTSIKDPSKLDKKYVGDWLTKVFGRDVYEHMWEPLLRSKLGDASENVSAAFIWATISRLYGARGKGSNKEKMGHVKGGYAAILTAIENKLSDLGITVNNNNNDVRKIESDGKNGFTVVSNKKRQKFNRVLMTVPCPQIIEMTKGFNKGRYWQEFGDIEYLGLVCVTLIINRKLSPYYVINLLDKAFPFTGIIESTNIISTESLGGKHIVYLPKYMPHDDPIAKKGDSEIVNLFIDKLKEVFPDLKDEDISHKKIFREKHVFTLPKLDHMKRNIGFKTPTDGMYISNNSMIHNSTLNNNTVISIAKNAVKTIIDDKL